MRKKGKGILPHITCLFRLSLVPLSLFLPFCFLPLPFCYSVYAFLSLPSWTYPCASAFIPAFLFSTSGTSALLLTTTQFLPLSFSLLSFCYSFCLCLSASTFLDFPLCLCLYSRYFYFLPLPLTATNSVSELLPLPLFSAFLLPSFCLSRLALVVLPLFQPFYFLSVSLFLLLSLCLCFSVFLVLKNKYIKNYIIYKSL